MQSLEGMACQCVDYMQAHLRAWNSSKMHAWAMITSADTTLPNQPVTEDSLSIQAVEQLQRSNAFIYWYVFFAVL